MTDHPALLLTALHSPESTLGHDDSQWHTLLRLLRRTELLPRFAAEAIARGFLGQLPLRVQEHLTSANATAAANARGVRWEVDRLERALRGAEFPVVLLKGAAYIVGGFPAARGRLCCDVDILVPQTCLAEAERRLLAQGWEVADVSQEHDRYFRTWLHELPPLRHRDRRTLVDVHHRILPRTDTLRVDVEELLRSALPLKESRFRVLSPEDMVIHSAVHLFRNGDFSYALRDLSDLDSLLRHFGRQPGFWQRLLSRVEQFQLTSPCYFAFHYVKRLLKTPWAPETANRIAGWMPGGSQTLLMDRLLNWALVPQQIESPDRRRELAIALLAYWPLPRWQAVVSPLFWTKRLRGMHAAH